MNVAATVVDGTSRSMLRLRYCCGLDIIRKPEYTDHASLLAPRIIAGQPLESSLTRRSKFCFRGQTGKHFPPLAKLSPPATVIDKTKFSGFAEPQLLSHLQAP